MGRTAEKLTTLRSAIRRMPMMVDGVMVPPPAPDAQPVDVWMEANLTPVYGPNIRWNGTDRSQPDAEGNPGWTRNNDCYAFCERLGMRKLQVAYAGTFNRSGWWAGRNSLEEYVRLGFSGNEDPTAYDPPKEDACRAIGSLSANPQRFDGTAEKNCPILLDIEQGECVFRDDDTPDVRRRKIKEWRDGFRWLREGAGSPTQKLFFYGQSQFWSRKPTTPPDPTLDAEMAAWDADLSAPCGFLYWNEESMLSPDRWRTDYMSTAAGIRRLSPTGGLVVLSPTINIYNKAAHPELAHLDGTPVPTDQFFGTVSLCAAAGISIMAWTGYTRIDSGVRPLLAFMARHNRTRSN